MPPGVQVKDPFAPPPPPSTIAPNSPLNSYGSPGSFTAAATTQASDYDSIMKQYADLAKSYSSNPITAGSVAPSSVSAPSPINFKSITPQLSTYSQSPDVTKSLSDLSELADTGGYSEAAKADIRARDISPIRSIYSSAQQNTERARALSGGYSPNFNAVTAQLARDEANKVSDVTTSANAGIAQNVASNRLAAASPYASASSSANAAKTAADQRNADIINEANKFNTSGDLSASEFDTSTAAGIAENNANRATSTGEFNTNAALQAALANKSGTLGAIQGRASLYGTTPALTKTFGDQVAQAGQLSQSQQELNNRKLATFGSIQ